MMHVLKRAWADMRWPTLQQPLQQQVAALCYRKGTAGTEVLLITSRDTGRWIVPKGWPMEGYDNPGSALQEAWEEAGVRKADIGKEAVGLYQYDKVLKNGATLPIMTHVFAARVQELSDEYPEASQRTRKWFSANEAADLVDEPQLKNIMASL